MNTYPEMNKQIVALLRHSSDPAINYAAARIEELEKQLEHLSTYAASVRLDRTQTIDGTRFCLQVDDWCDGLIDHARQAQQSIAHRFV